jgi:hypothetical protein
MTHTFGKLSTRATTFFHTSPRSEFAHKVMGLQSCGSLNFGNFGLPLGSLMTKWHLGVMHIVYYKGEGGGFPQVWGRGEFCESGFAHGSFVHQKCSSYALTNLLFSLCRSMWVIELLVNLPSPHLGAATRPFTLEVLWTSEHAPTPPFAIFTFGLVVESIQESGGCVSLCH